MLEKILPLVLIFLAGYLLKKLKVLRSEDTEVLGKLLANEIQTQYRQEELPQLIIPIPLHVKRLKERGYNQAQLLSEILAVELGIVHSPKLLQRRKETPALANLGRKQRVKTLKGAFIAQEAKGLNVLLIDDIFTTGATAEMCSQALIKDKVKSVCYLSLAAGKGLL